MICPSVLPNLSVLGVTAVEACTAMWRNTYENQWAQNQSLGLGIAISTVACLVGGLHCFSGPDLLD